MTVFYADASALVKLVHEEAESPALRTFLTGADLVSSGLALAEIPRAARRLAAREKGLSLNLLLERADQLTGALAIRPIDHKLLARAGSLAEPALRSLDAIHVASAVSLASIDGFVTYDERQAAAARLSGLRTVAPGT
jgi:predicted nucleic acid-binding protein